MADGGGGSNTTHALLSPDPETLPIGGVSRPATGEFLETQALQTQPTVASYAPSTAGPNFTLSQRYGPAFIPQELVAENGLFQPKLKLAQKSPKLTPRPDPPGTDEATDPMPFEYEIPWSPHPTWFPLRSRHQGNTYESSGVMMPKITKIGVIPTRGPPGQGKANGSQGRRQDLGLISECTT